ncbi:hypothetical protein V144x_17380 [Gimesia aquarii]|uniref:Uncharacterized protein n=1 Tax=Gimesia aquarii TaxID=2527964 RepID=A0A517VTE5_9PLAN|nr:hypothetical protein V144x_17380 [Gimesia aquarii]
MTRQLLLFEKTNEYYLSDSINMYIIFYWLNVYMWYYEIRPLLLSKCLELVNMIEGRNK